MLAYWTMAISSIGRHQNLVSGCANIDEKLKWLRRFAHVYHRESASTSDDLSASRSVFNGFSLTLPLCLFACSAVICNECPSQSTRKAPPNWHKCGDCFKRGARCSLLLESGRAK